jgi:hypothetical protein
MNWTRETPMRAAYFKWTTGGHAYALLPNIGSMHAFWRCHGTVFVCVAPA